MYNFIPTELFVETKGAPPLIFIDGNITVTLKVPRPFGNDKGKCRQMLLPVARVKEHENNEDSKS